MITTGVAMAAAADQPATSPQTTAPTAPSGSATIATVGGSQYAPSAAAPAKTVPIATTTTTSSVPASGSTTSEAASTATSSSKPSPTTSAIAANPPSEILVIGGDSAAMIASELARAVAPLRVRVLTGEPLTKALQLLSPTATSRVIVLDPQPPTEQQAATFITDVVTAAKDADVLWVQDWHTKRHWWVDLVAAQAASSAYSVLEWHAEVDKTPRYRDAKGAITVAGVARLVELLGPLATSSLKSP